jgi:hypothetical protein
VSIAGLLALALTLVHTPAAQAAAGRVAFLPLQGPGAEQLEKILVQVFPSELGLLPLTQVDRALAQAGAVLPVSSAQHAVLGRRAWAMGDLESSPKALRSSGIGIWKMSLAQNWWRWMASQT